MSDTTNELVFALRQRLLSLTVEAGAFPAVAQGHTLLAKDAGLGDGPITSEQALEIRDGGVAIGKSAGAIWIIEEIDKVLDEWERKNL